MASLTRKSSHFALSLSFLVSRECGRNFAVLNHLDRILLHILYVMTLGCESPDRPLRWRRYSLEQISEWASSTIKSHLLPEEARESAAPLQSCLPARVPALPSPIGLRTRRRVLSPKSPGM